MPFRDLYFYLYHQNPSGGLQLQGAGVVVACLLIISHVWAWLKRHEAQAFLQSFPRSTPWGILLLTLAYLWALLAVAHMDMGEFFFLREEALFTISLFYVGMLVYVREFLAVRALGCLLLLSAGLVLEAAFLRPQVSRLLLPVLAYAWIVIGMFFVGTPFRMRVWVSWVIAKPARWNATTLGGLIYGAVILFVAIVDWGA